ncbi:hypothetical protein L1987_60250 [Smallanthus sonchifolius]|uniref:Uncharacterized protein n=1 Tax=Smallanthus sonchifolius TaxID=185202 RepID=A0ACB9D7I5_9ASTR|nr:hypothetical protein L1987_60250 [Smallanthus sonchifolius]
MHNHQQEHDENENIMTVWVYMKNNSSHGRRIFAWRCISKILNWAGSHRFLHSVAQIGIHTDVPTPDMGTNPQVYNMSF